MATAGPNNPSASSSTAWTNPTNAYSSDNQWATSTTVTYISLTGYGFAIPAGSTINGITVSIERHAADSSKFVFCQDNTVKLIIGGSAVGANKADSGTKWPTSDATVNYGGVADLWTLTPTVAQVNGSDFGVYFIPANNGTTAYLDVITITITYTAGATGISIPVAMHHYRTMRAQ